MKELLVISGKGGTGKTSITVSLAALAENALFADCDVDAADMALILKPENQIQEDFYSGFLASVEPSRCTGCGKCSSLCRFGAFREEGGKFFIDPLACEGCGVCYDHCPVEAISFEPRLCGKLYLSSTPYGPLVHARLGAGGENSGKLVSQVKQRARTLGEEQNRSLLITDGPPGIGCSVIASLGGVEGVLIVTEPTVSGIHDLQRIQELCEHFRIPAFLCVNKGDLNSENTQEIRAFGEQKGIQWLGEIPYDVSVTQAMIEEIPVVKMPASPAGKAIVTIWENLKNQESLFG